MELLLDDGNDQSTFQSFTYKSTTQLNLQAVLVLSGVFFSSFLKQKSLTDEMFSQHCCKHFNI